MIKIIRYILTYFILPVYSWLFIRTKVRKTRSDLKTNTYTIYALDKKIHVDSIAVKKIDTETSFLKNESLIGITLVGKVYNTDNTNTFNYFDSLTFLDTVDNQLKHISIEIIPTLKSVLPNQKESKLANTKVKYNFLSNATQFEFYVEKVIVFSGFGNYSIDIKCAESKATIELFRYK